MQSCKSIFMLFLVFCAGGSPPVLLASAEQALPEQVLFYYTMLRHDLSKDITRGKVCEKVAEIKLRDDYPEEDFVIFSNMVYGSKKPNLHKVYLQVEHRQSGKVVFETKIRLSKDERQLKKRIRQSFAQVKRQYSEAGFWFKVKMVYKTHLHVVGELDLVVVSRQTNKVVAVVEVKCSANLKGASKKAKEQLARFRHVSHGPNYIYDFLDEEDHPLIAWNLLLTDDDVNRLNFQPVSPPEGSASAGDETHLSFEQFDNDPAFRLLSQRSPIPGNYGFETFPLSIHEVDQLTAKLRESELMVAAEEEEPSCEHADALLDEAANFFTQQKAKSKRHVGKKRSRKRVLPD